MTAANFPIALAFVWQPQFDSPRQGFHATPGDPGGATLGGVIQTTWADAAIAGLVQGSLEAATDDQLSTILRAKFWGLICNNLPSGLDLALFNGRMMTGYFPRIFQQCLGLMGHDDVDGWIGPESQALAESRDPGTFLDALAGAHVAYLSNLSTWAQFGGGWTTRIKAARTAALALVGTVPIT